MLAHDFRIEPFVIGTVHYAVQDILLLLNEPYAATLVLLAGISSHIFDVLRVYRHSEGTTAPWLETVIVSLLAVSMSGKALYAARIARSSGTSLTQSEAMIKRIIAIWTVGCLSVLISGYAEADSRMVRFMQIYAMEMTVLARYGRLCDGIA